MIKNENSNSNYYVINDELVEELKKSRNNGEPTKELSDMFSKLALKVSGSYIYDSNDDRYDCVGHAYMILMEKWNKWNPDENTNAFSFYTQVALNGLRAGWNILNRKKKFTVSIDNIFEENI